MPFELPAFDLSEATAVKQALVENGIDLPFETRVVLFHDQTEETDGDRRRQREGWPAGEGEAPKSRKIAGAIRELAERRGRESDKTLDG
jgi:small conductance mechanosensitive channel